MCARSLIAAALLVPYLLATLGRRAALARLRAAWRPCWAVAGTLAVVLSFVSYASGSIYGQRRVATVAGPVLASGSMLASATMLLPFAAAQLPLDAPGWKATSSWLALAILGTAAAQLILFRLLATAGARRTSLVTYLMPGFALAYGAILLDEPVTTFAVVGLASILAGATLGSGARRRPEHEVVSAPVSGR